MNCHSSRFAIKLPTFSYVCNAHEAAGRWVLVEWQVCKQERSLAGRDLNGRSEYPAIRFPSPVRDVVGCGYAEVDNYVSTHS